MRLSWLTLITVLREMRRRVTRAQLESLWVFLSCHKNVAVGYNKTVEDRDKYRRLWMRVAKNINGLDGGGVKDWRGWAKYWNDYKSKLKIRRKASETKKMRFTDLERKFLTLISFESDHLDNLEVKLSHEINSMSGISNCDIEPMESSNSLEGFVESNDKQQINVMEKLVHVLKDIHKVLIRIEQKIPQLQVDTRNGNECTIPDRQNNST